MTVISIEPRMIASCNGVPFKPSWLRSASVSIAARSRPYIPGSYRVAQFSGSSRLCLSRSSGEGQQRDAQEERDSVHAGLHEDAWPGKLAL
jgi:hypothetical protein